MKCLQPLVLKGLFVGFTTRRSLIQIWLTQPVKLKRASFFEALFESHC